MSAKVNGRVSGAGIVTLAAMAILVAASGASAQTSGDGYRDAHRLGGTTSFYRPALTNVATLKRMATTKGMDADIRKVLSDAGIPETADAVVAMLSGGAPSVVGASCSEATPQPGVLVECDFQRGATLEWMAYRPNIHKGNRAPERIQKFRWAGRQAFKAFLFRVVSNNRTYTFVVPKPCGNLSLMSMVEAPRPTTAAAPAVAPPPPAPAPRVTPPPPAPPARVEAPAVEAPRPAPPAAVVAPAVASKKASPFFADVLFGKDRRVRPVSDRETNSGALVSANAGPDDFAQCSPLLGLKFGAGKRFANDWELNGAVGIGFSFAGGDDEVKEHELFVDVEANKYLGRGFIGTGFSVWDITHSDTVTPAVLFQFGVPLSKEHPIYFVGQARAFLDHADDLSNNYLMWAGVRVRF